MNKIKSIVLASMVIATGLASCDSGDMRRTPGHIYAPDMTYSRAYDAYTSNPNFEDGQTSRLPAEGTIARGHQLPDHLKKDDTMAYKTFTTSLRFNDDELKEGGRLFNIYCAICHGTGLDGQGPLFAGGKFASMPANFKDAKYLKMPVGQMYAAMKYGKNMMGSYAAQLDMRQRWMVIAYIKKFQSTNNGNPYMFAAMQDGKIDTANADNKVMAKAEGAPIMDKSEPKKKIRKRSRYEY